MSLPSRESKSDFYGHLSIPSIIFCVVTPIFVALRVASRLHIARRLGSDDWTIIASSVFSVAVSIVMIVDCKWVSVKRINEPEIALVHRTLKLLLSVKVLYKVTIALTKLSILLLYLRIFTNKVFRRICWALIVIVISYQTGSAAASIFQCTPVRRAWDKQVPGTCVNSRVTWYANAAFNISSDLAILILPMPVVKSLQLPKKARIGLMAVFALGIFVCITSLLRATTSNRNTSGPMTWSSSEPSTWSVIEINVGIICACIPTYRASLSKFFPREFSSFNYPGSGQGSKDEENADGSVSQLRVSVGTVPLYKLSIPVVRGRELVAEKLEIWTKRLGNGGDNSACYDEKNGDVLAESNACRRQSIRRDEDLESFKGSSVTFFNSESLGG
ncbi:hypothetical protein AJ79_04943 [Helicocarpus griseus UAMH5409]|uniref:Rhodopsin domain-containing protein n=1 Tax=Helicocarpus griseus UAMH5409 TaxID=1447875 RepID=A0A2B7XS66_9EURO|nr:hypothetical protein AJ79_04943 [Helicocarpus griseus UAMH5409]